MSNKVVLDIQNLSIQFGGLKAVDNLSIQIMENEIFGLIGPNGAGKTTVFNCITQFYKANSGTITFESNTGEIIDLMKEPVHAIVGKGLVRTFQNVELIRELSIIDNVLIGAHVRFKSSILSQFISTKKARQEEAALRDKAEQILSFLDILHLKDALAGGQPYGVLKKVELARALISEPKLIILDEPAAGLNDVETAHLAQTIRKIRDDMKCSILLVEHDMRLVMDVCDRICAISFGKQIATGTAKEIQMNPHVQEAYLGSDGDL